ncbi:hypothetical protein [Azospirillum sp. ST 5-10]|uniref:hypothetical protein n=1 Tax=unclassified Azospirillum TaxID=2630922 RepID=UPI003F4A250A
MTDLPTSAALLTAPTAGRRRPSLALPIVRELAARALAGRAAEALRRPDEPAVAEETVAAQLVAVTRHHRDAHAIADGLARHYGHRAGAALLEVLDDFTVEMLRAHDSLVAAWAAAHAVRPSLGFGDAVRVTTNDRSWRRVTVDGEIVGVDLVHARYLVRSAALGHGDGPRDPKARAIPFEDVRAAAEAEEPAAAPAPALAAAA